jgi:FkbM family methyltransferase
MIVVMAAAVLAFLLTVMPAMTELDDDSVRSALSSTASSGTSERESPSAPAADELPAKQLELSSIDPLIDNGTHLMIVYNTTTNPVEYLTVSALSNHKLAFPDTVKRVFVEVGTNDEPELGPLLLNHRDAMLIGFEPQPEVFKAMIAKFPWKKRIVTIPAAVTPTRGFTNMFISEHKGCSSMLNMNTKARDFADKHGKKAVKKSGVIQLRTIKYCASTTGSIAVPSFPLLDVLGRIPDNVIIDLVMIDAQGFDIFVVSTIGRNVANRTRFIVLECQDLTPGHTLFLVEGAPSCDQQRRCVEAALPHRLDHCWDNSPKVREYNCLYRLPDVPITEMPKGIKWVSQPREIAYPESKPFHCPIFL